MKWKLVNCFSNSEKIDLNNIELCQSQSVVRLAINHLVSSSKNFDSKYGKPRVFFGKTTIFVPLVQKYHFKKWESPKYIPILHKNVGVHTMLQCLKKIYKNLLQDFKEMA